MFNTVWKAISDFFSMDFPTSPAYKLESLHSPYQWIEEDWLDEMSVAFIAISYETTDSNIIYILTNLGYDVTSDYPREITLPRDRTKYPILSCC